MISSKQMTPAWFDTGTLIQHSGIGGFGKWDDLRTNSIPQFD